MKLSRKLVGVIACVCAIGLAPAPAFAQPELSGGYQFLRLSADGSGTNIPVGFAFDYAHPLGDAWRAVGQFDWARKSLSESFGDFDGSSVESSLTQVTFAGGLRYSGARARPLTPYAQVLIGATRTRASIEINDDDFGGGSSTDFVTQLGVGAAYMLNEKWGAVGEADYRALFVGETVHQLRLFAGLRLKVR